MINISEQNTYKHRTGQVPRQSDIEQKTTYHFKTPPVTRWGLGIWHVTIPPDWTPVFDTLK